MINFYSKLTYNRKHFWINGDFLIHFLAHLVEAETVIYRYSRHHFCFHSNLIKCMEISLPLLLCDDSGFF